MRSRVSCQRKLHYLQAHSLAVGLLGEQPQEVGEVVSSRRGGVLGSSVASRGFGFARFAVGISLARKNRASGYLAI